jgi:hypothetical protein
MDREVFRFVSVRPVQELASPTQPQPLMLRLDRGDSRFLSSLREHADYAKRAKLLELVRAFVRSPQFVGSRGKADRRLAGFHERLAGLPEKEFAQAAGDAFRQAFDSDPGSFARGDRRAWARRRG